MADLEEQLKQADCEQAKFKLIITDGVFSMDGIIAQVDKICDLADKYDAMVCVDDSHATGFIGKNGRGSAEYCDVLERVDLITTTFGKALGGASGGCVSGKREIIEMLRQRSRPYLFSNSLAPPIVGATLEVLNMLSSTSDLRDKLIENTRMFREGISKAGYTIVPGTHPIVPIMLGHHPNDAKLSQELAEELLENGIYVIGFYYPVVPKGKSRIRVQISAAHTTEHIQFAIDTFSKIRKEWVKKGKFR